MTVCCKGTLLRVGGKLQTWGAVQSTLQGKWVGRFWTQFLMGVDQVLTVRGWGAPKCCGEEGVAGGEMSAAGSEVGGPRPNGVPRTARTRSW